MCLANKIVIGLIFIVSLGMVYFAARALKTHQAWRENAIAFQKAIEREQKAIQETLNGKADGTPGIRQTKLALDKYLNRRGRAWFHAKIQSGKLEGAKVTVTTELPPPKDAKNKQLFVFEETPKGAYLGEFNVVDVNGKRWDLEPSAALSPAEATRYRDSGATWALYEAIPSEDPELNADLELAARQAKENGATPVAEPLPPVVHKGTFVEVKPDELKPETAEEKAALAKYWKTRLLKACKNDDEKRAISGMNDKALGDSVDKAVSKASDRVAKQINQLGDYEHFFNAWIAQRPVMAELFAAEDHDRDTLKASLERIQAEVESIAKLVNVGKGELRVVTDQKQLVSTHCEALERAGTALEQDSQQLIGRIQAAAGELTRLQVEFLRMIDERTKKVVRIGTGT